MNGQKSIIRAEMIENYCVSWIDRGSTREVFEPNFSVIETNILSTFNISFYYYDE